MMRIKVVSLVLACLIGMALLLSLTLATPGQCDAPVGPPANLATGTPYAATPPIYLDMQPDLSFTPVATTYLPVISRFLPLLYFDDFSNPGSGWKIADEGYAEWAYKGELYEMTIHAYNSRAEARAPYGPTDNYVVEADMYRPPQGVSGAYGLIFGASEDLSSYYTFVIAPDEGKFAVWRWDGSQWVTIIGWTLSSYIHSGTGLNHLKVSRADDRITLYVNNHWLATTSDANYTGPLYVGLYAQSHDAAPAMMRYDNFAVYNLD